jgi:AcrR family transcriptional regulator
MARKPAPGARDRILDNAARLFSEHGIHAVGLQQVIDECGCGKNLLYREFASKDDLVVAWLERCRAEWRVKVADLIEPLAGDPAAQLLAIVRANADEVTAPGYRGCAVRNTYTEFADPEHPAHGVSIEYLGEMRDLLQRLSVEAGARDPDVLADRIMLIIDGLLSNGATLGEAGAAAEATEFAADVIAAATGRAT